MEEIISKFFEFNNALRSHNIQIVLLLAVGFTFASILGYFAWRLKLSPILGYLLAGYLIGPYSPGYVANVNISDQLAEIGVILMMFGVGLNFKVRDLLNVKNIAIPGAITQTAFSAICTALIVKLFGGPISTGIIIGLAVGVASTVVLIRMLSDHHMLSSKEGHIAVGWLIVEDVITVVILILLPNIASLVKGTHFSAYDTIISLAAIFVKFFFLIFISMTVGHRFVSYVLAKVMKTRSHELFTLAVLAATFALASGSAIIFGISMALGAFIAGLIIGQTELREQALVHSLSMKDAFIVVFFLSVGMLFNPAVIVQNFAIFICILTVILILKPFAAFMITVLLKYPFKTALIIAISLAQIGEFSFILSEEAMKFGLISDDAYDIVVACALVSIALNPLIFKFICGKKETLKSI